ncbi:zinc-dependent metalloprotease [Cellulomonas sp. ATA003]|uniref:zinc-dependent metalloprotease n=1 Tax=Cellulomonas sp. ATA003 TaxID=3073064 RepID=UPI0028733A9D|nr:zinc-dependent metalloprotease [Cellulomonas sp. ATA003]WNB85308.1 zinc-dependent metalloprotease [Cellulomonas sp. ATA003]
MQVGAVLAALSGTVLGQFDPFSPAPVDGPVDGSGGGPSRGRLLLVAPNVLTVERALRVDPADFRLWVALHEQTHALQFATAPWLADHLRGRMAALLAGLADDDGPLSLGAARSALRGGDGDDGGLPALLPPDTRRALDEVGAVMALLEGHADVAMDAVGRSVVPSVRQIRARFDRRRAGSRRLGTVVLRRLLGLDVKLAQYRDGAAFVRRVRRAVGPDGLNAVWAAPDHLPSAAEIAQPRTWVRRVHG